MKQILIFLAAFFAGESQPFAKGYIIGGQEVSRPDPVAASTVGIYTPIPGGKGGSLCTGTLLRDDIVLTAAHCIPSAEAKPVVLFGPDLHSPSTQRAPSEAVAIHPSWGRKSGLRMDQGDIALVKFAGGLPEGYRKASMIRSDTAIKNGKKIVLAGYGISNAITKTGAGRLRRTEVSVFNNRPGQSEMILDQSQGHGACHGDSGGPAFLQRNGKLVLAGLTNRSYPPGAQDDCAHKVVYTKVPSYRSWIQRSERKLGSSERRVSYKEYHGAVASAFSKRIKAGNPRSRKRISRAPKKRRAIPQLKVAKKKVR